MAERRCETWPHSKLRVLAGHGSRKNVMHNREFLIALILDGEGRSDGVLLFWGEPRTDMGNGRKRVMAIAFVEAGVPVQQPAIDFDAMDAER